MPRPRIVLIGYLLLVIGYLPSGSTRVSGVAIATANVRISNGAEMKQEPKNRTKKFALDVIGLCAGLPHLPETRHAIDQLIRSSSSVAANYSSA